MAINIKTTGDLKNNGVKILVYGQAGAGKTTLIKTLPQPIILSVEGGLLSIKDADLPYVEIKTITELSDVYSWIVSSDEAVGLESVALDSISEFAELVLNEQLKTNKDGRGAYGDMNQIIAGIIRTFRDLPGKNVYFSAKVERAIDESGKMLYSPNMPGKSLTAQLPYFFDFVLPLRTEKDHEGIMHRMLQCETDGLWLAKSRSTKLAQWEEPDLSALITKIIGEDI